MGKEPWRTLDVALKVRPKPVTHFCFFSDRQASIHGHQDREHEQSQQRRPMKQEAQQDQHERHVLRMPDD